MRFCRVFCIFLPFLAAAPLHADTVRFDNLDASAGDVLLTSYQGYTFNNFSVYTTIPGFPGFTNGIVSGPNAAYSSDIGSIAAANTFDFTGAALGSGYYDNLQVTIQGLLGGNVLYSQTLDLSTTGAQAYNFNFTKIDELLFTTSITGGTTDPYYCGAVGCSYFTLDDAQLTPDFTSPVTPTPEPPTWALLATGLLAALLLRRMRFSHS